MDLPATHYELLTSTRFDPFLLSLQWNNDEDGPSPFLLLPFHLDRLIAGAKAHGWGHARNYMTYELLKSTCRNVVADSQSLAGASKALKIRLTLSESGVLVASASPTYPFTSDPTSASFFNPVADNASLFGPVLSIDIDPWPTTISIFTTTKTTHRAVYDEARSRTGVVSYPTLNHLVAPSDVLMYNPRYLITEASIFNVALYRTPYWITPTASTGCLPGVLRRWLLEQGRIHEDRDSLLTRDSIKEGDWILLFNGVQGCRLGRIASTNAKQS